MKKIALIFGVTGQDGSYLSRFLLKKNYIDQGMRKTHPDFDWPDNGDTDGGDATVTTNQPSTVVAPSARNNGAKPRKVRMTATQVALAKRLGLTNEQYARHAEMIK